MNEIHHSPNFKSCLRKKKHVEKTPVFPVVALAQRHHPSFKTHVVMQ